jgi:hypothetical protein
MATYENCGKKGIYEKCTLCRTHKNANTLYNAEMPDRNSPPIPIYCKKCDNREKTLNCRSGLERCKNIAHLCAKCACNITEEQKASPISHYRSLTMPCLYQHFEVL